jgi:hypothetical protein
MINPLTLYSKIMRMQKEVMKPLYGNHPSYAHVNHDKLLLLTGKAIAPHVALIHEVCSSPFIAVYFKCIKLIGGAPQLTEDDFERFTNYVKDGGLEAMLRMLEAEHKFNTFSDELAVLPQRVRDNAELMLTKSKVLHTDFVIAYLRKNNDGPIPEVCTNRVLQTNAFIDRLMQLSRR